MGSPPLSDCFSYPPAIGPGFRSCAAFVFRFRNTGSGLHRNDMGGVKRRSRGAKQGSFSTLPTLDFQPFSPSRFLLMTLVSIPANPVPEDVVSGTIKTPDGAELRFAR